MQPTPQQLPSNVQPQHQSGFQDDNAEMPTIALNDEHGLRAEHCKFFEVPHLPNVVVMNSRSRT